MKKNSEIRKKWFIEQVEKLHANGMNYADIALKLGKLPQYLNNIRKGDGVVGEKLVADFGNAFDINLNSLFNRYKEYEVANDSFSAAEPQVEMIIEKRQDAIPLIPIEAVAGYGKGDLSVMDNELIDRYVIPDFAKRGVKFLIRVSGSSMYPKYSNGDILACRPITDTSFFQWGKIYVLDTEQGALVKRIYEGKSNEYVECRSDNKEQYPPFQMPKLSIRSISIVIGVVRLE